MAAKKSKTPASRYLRYEMQMSANAGTEVSAYIDIAKDLSAMNRRLYRQGREYHIKRITVVSSNTPNGGNRISFSTAPNTWVTRNAWKRGFAVYKEMNKNASRNLSSDVAGTYDDFKVYLSNTHRTGTELSPNDNGGNNVQPGEWVYSQFVTPDGTATHDEFETGLLGTDVGAAGTRTYVGLIRSYALSRATVQVDSPNVDINVRDDPLVNVLDSGTQIDEVLENLIQNGDNTPYNTGAYPGGTTNMPLPVVVQDTTIVDGKATVGGFSAICGLIEVEAKTQQPNDVLSILVEVAPGNYRGVAAEVI